MNQKTKKLLLLLLLLFFLYFLYWRYKKYQILPTTTTKTQTGIPKQSITQDFTQYYNDFWEFLMLRN